MLETYFQGIVLTSLLGTVFALILLALKPVTGKHFGESWQYYIWLVVLVAMLFPIRIEIPELSQNQALSHATAQFGAVVEDVFERIGWKMDQVQYDEAGRRLYSPHLQEKRMREAAVERVMYRSVSDWFMVAAFLFLYKVLYFHYYVSELKKISWKVDCPEIAEYTRRKVEVRRGAFGNSPLLLGVFRPVLLLPDRDMTKEQLGNVLAHEMTHLRRNDMLYKWFVVLVKCIHWFNPVVYLINKEVNQSCEISCDLSVTERMNSEQKMSYVETILALFTDQRHRDYALTMGMTGSKKLLKKRFLKMKNRIVVTEKMRKISGMVATVMLVGVMLLSGCMAAKAFPDLSDQNLLPVVSYCKRCGQEVLYSGRELAVKKDNSVLKPFYKYQFHCTRCGHEWREEQFVTSAYVTNWSGRTVYLDKVEDLIAYAEVEEPEGFFTRVMNYTQ